MSCYEALAGAYDALTEDVGYAQRADFLEKLLRRSAIPVKLVLDLACGTGTLTCLLAKEGYDLIGVDASTDMLAQAMDKCLEQELEPQPLLVCQSMEHLQLFGPVDACVCSLDSLNYLIDQRRLATALRRVGHHLRPGGLFLFDVIPAWEFARRDGETYVDETEDTLCLWRASFDKRRQTITYGLDLFRQEADGRWSREQEEHRERGWSLELLEQLLEQAGFAWVQCYGEDRKSAPTEADGRVFFVCRKEMESEGEAE